MHAALTLLLSKSFKAAAAEVLVRQSVEFRKHLDNLLQMSIPCSAVADNVFVLSLRTESCCKRMVSPSSG